MSLNNFILKPPNLKTHSNRSQRTSVTNSDTCHHCRQTQQELNEHIVALKDKAHQSFMQVIQIQQLHEEELQLLKDQFNEKKKEFQQTISNLQSENACLKKELGELERNSKRHSYNFDPAQLIIDNIDSIICPSEDYSSLDQSDYQQFRQILDGKAQNQNFSNIKKELLKQLKGKANRLHIQRLFKIISDIKEQNTTLTQENEKLVKTIEEAEKKLKNMKNVYQSLIKQSKFMTEHVKRVSNDKLKLQKKIAELQRLSKAEEQNTISNITKSLQYEKKRERCMSPNRGQLKDNANLTSLRSENLLELDKGLEKRGSIGLLKKSDIKSISQMECFKKKKKEMLMSEVVQKC